MVSTSNSRAQITIYLFKIAGLFLPIDQVFHYFVFRVKIAIKNYWQCSKLHVFDFISGIARDVKLNDGYVSSLKKKFVSDASDKLKRRLVCVLGLATTYDSCILRILHQMHRLLWSIILLAC